MFACAKVHSDSYINGQNLKLSPYLQDKILTKNVIVKHIATQNVYLSVPNMGDRTYKSTNKLTINKTIKSIEGSGDANGIQLYINNTYIPLVRGALAFRGIGCPYNGGGFGDHYYWTLTKDTLAKYGIAPSEQYTILVVNDWDQFHCKTYVNFSITFNYDE